jgi:hypothetical protein
MYIHRQYKTNGPLDKEMTMSEAARNMNSNQRIEPSF